MIPNQQNASSLIVAPVGETLYNAISLREEDQLAMMELVQTGIYTRKELAVLREITMNAIDETRASGATRKPKVTLPTHNSPELVIRDYGRGLSLDGMMDYLTFGRSMKRESNAVHGFMGVGSKSPACIANMYYVTTFHGGKKTTYVAAREGSGKNGHTPMSVEDTTETGLEVRVPVKRDQIDKFRAEALHLFRFLRHEVDINLTIPDPKPSYRWFGKSGALSMSGNYESPVWEVAVDGVPYRLDIKQLPFVPEFVKKSTGGVLFLGIGSCDIAASREEVRYSERTLETLNKAFDDIFTEFGNQALDLALDPNITQWSLRDKMIPLMEVMPTLRSIPVLAPFHLISEGRFGAYVTSSNFSFTVCKEARRRRIGSSDRTLTRCDEYVPLSRKSAIYYMRSGRDVSRVFSKAMRRHYPDLVVVRDVPQDKAEPKLYNVGQTLDDCLREMGIHGIDVWDDAKFDSIAKTFPSDYNHNRTKRSGVYLLGTATYGTYLTGATLPGDDSEARFIVIPTFYGRVVDTENVEHYGSIYEALRLLGLHGLALRCYGVKRSDYESILEEDERAISYNDWCEEALAACQAHPDYEKYIRAYAQHHVFHLSDLTLIERHVWEAQGATQSDLDHLSAFVKPDPKLDTSIGKLVINGFGHMFSSSREEHFDKVEMVHPELVIRLEIEESRRRYPLIYAALQSNCIDSALKPDIVKHCLKYKQYIDKENP